MGLFTAAEPTETWPKGPEDTLFRWASLRSRGWFAQNPIGGLRPFLRTGVRERSRRRVHSAADEARHQRLLARSWEVNNPQRELFPKLRDDGAWQPVKHGPNLLSYLPNRRMCGSTYSETRSGFFGKNGTDLSDCMRQAGLTASFVRGGVK